MSFEQQSMLHNRPRGHPQNHNPLEICDSTHRINAPATLVNYYRIAFALIRGDAHRPRLPLELVLYICRYAELTWSSPNRVLSGLHAWAGQSSRRICGNFIRNPPPRGLVPLVKTEPLTREALSSIERIEVFVKFVQNYKTKVSTASDLRFLNLA